MPSSLTALLVAIATQEPANLHFRPSVGDELRVVFELDWRLGTCDEEILVHFGKSNRRIPIDIELRGERELVWRDHWLAVIGTPTYRRTWDRLRGEDSGRVFPLHNSFETRLESPLEGRACLVRREAGAWVAEWEGRAPDQEQAILEALAWEVGLEELLPTDNFRYIDGAACRALLRPAGWPPWRALKPAPWVEERLLSSPLAYPSLKDPRAVLRRRAHDVFEIELEIRETIDLAVAASALPSTEFGRLVDWGDSARLEFEGDGRGWLRWSSEQARPLSVSLDVDLEIVLAIEGEGIRAVIETEGTLHQRMTFERVETNDR